jgi:hypothetical protein
MVASPSETSGPRLGWYREVGRRFPRTPHVNTTHLGGSTSTYSLRMKFVSSILRGYVPPGRGRELPVPHQAEASKGLASFWTSQSEAKPSVGSGAVFRFAGAPVDLKMRIDGLEPGKRVAWSCQGDFPHWAGTTVSWEQPVENPPHATSIG